METLALILGFLGVFVVGMIVRPVLVALLLAMIVVPLVAIALTAEALWEWSGRWTAVHRLRQKTTQCSGRIG